MAIDAHFASNRVEHGPVRRVGRRELAMGLNMVVLLRDLAAFSIRQFDGDQSETDPHPKKKVQTGTQKRDGPEDRPYVPGRRFSERTTCRTASCAAPNVSHMASQALATQSLAV